ncbi:11871_t:CDS:2 [Entrophospora sp. SA101]|nr:11817_t:CDS:2 [Entrophospora sp. SA101]CAJ0824859.1 11871_t:CDS:2 [Entrophospora sp. SA101]CAJ0915038.1 18790_t:CDS:2 [Entrophospora sp. SA101]
MSTKKSKFNKDDSLPNLPSEIIDCILKHIKDQNTLFSCLLVNRLWCRKVVPVLWASPKPLFNSSYVNNGSNRNDGVDKVEGDISGIGEDSVHNNNNFNLLNLSNPLFEYAAFLKELDYNVLRTAVRKSYKNIGGKEFSRKIKPLKPDLNPTRQMTVMKALIKLFTRCSVLDSVKFNSLHDDIPNFFLFVEGQHSLSNVSKLHVSSSSDLPNTLALLNRLSLLCSNIRHLIIDSTDLTTSENLADIIRAQQNLISLELHGNFINVSPVFLSLETHISTLTSIKFVDIDYQWKLLEILSKCINLKSLEVISNINNLNDEDQDSEKELNFVLPPTICNLKSLKLINQKSIYSSLIFQTSGGSVKKLSLNTINKRVVDSILKFCSGVNDLSLDISNTPHHDFSQHLRLLKGLRLINLKFTSDTANDMDLLLPEITHILPKSLLNLDLEKEFTLEPLGNFINLCKTPIKELTVFPNAPIDSDYISTIINYSKKNSSFKKLHLNLSWESSLINDRYTKGIIKDPIDELFTIDLEKLRDHVV